ncbi:MAG: SAM-dependent methyltransferase [Halobacteriovoraceae bacterium]|nr:SAM-dependent methyltransferase [Halobacteriovoraceae bacterium]
MNLINRFAQSKNSALIDVGGGASRLIDQLLLEGFNNPTVLDISEYALNHSKERLGKNKSQVNWVIQDIKEFTIHTKFDIWHDRALFHFLNSQDEKKSYLKNLDLSLKKGGVAILFTFSEDGPLKCSGLEITRYDESSMVSLFGPNYKCIHFQKETHLTPANKKQHFNIWVFKKIK